jgi:L-ribulose-5-phosphate 4-epimerase
MVHTHSPLATAWAQAGCDLPCFGTTHADYFNGTIPCTAELTQAEIFEGCGYEHNTGESIVREFWKRGIDPSQVPAALVRGHAPFVWGEDAPDAVHNAVVLEAIAGIARDTVLIRGDALPISQALLDKHYGRKHGPEAYYGQPGTV